MAINLLNKLLEKPGYFSPGLLFGAYLHDISEILLNITMLQVVKKDKTCFFLIF